LPLIPHIANRQDWHVLVDEEMQVLRQYSHHVPHTNHIITDEIKLRSYNAGYSRVAPRNHASLAEKGRNKDDDEVLTKFAETFRILNNPNWESFVNTAQYSRLIAGEIMTLDFHSVLTPKIFDGFASVFMASANFEHTAIYQLWGDWVRFQRDQQFCNGLRFKQHENGNLITIYFGIDGAWSKKLASQNIDRLIDASKQLLGDAPFLWQANKSMKDDPFGPNGTRLPNKPHGRNDYADFHNLIFLSALNPPTSHFKFLEAQGFQSEDVRRAIYFQTAYQAMMRTSIRNAQNQHPKRIIVPDHALAGHLQAKFPGCRIERLDNVDETIINKPRGRPRQYASHAERQAAYLRRKMLVFPQKLPESFCDENTKERIL
jgi:hypothetical protein